jgi:2'-5' RNA ligase
MRSFIAIDLPDAVRDALATLQLGLRVGRSVPPENFHLTLAFLGDQTEEALEELHHALDIIAGQRFELHLSGLGVIGATEPRVLFADVEPNSALDQLYKQVKTGLRSVGVILPRRRFQPHVTLARFRPSGLLPTETEILRRFLEQNASFNLKPFPVLSFALYQSRLHPDGAVHEVLARYPLQ